MPLPSGTQLTPHFTAHELGADIPAATDGIVANLREVAVYLEMVRRELSNAAGYEVPLKIVSGLRTSAHNAEVGGSQTSNHLDGRAADFVPLNSRKPAGKPAMTLYRANRVLNDAVHGGQLPAFDQLIYYPLDGHIHIGLGSRQRRETLIRIAERLYVPLTDDLLRKLPGFADAVARVGSTVSVVADNEIPWLPLIALSLLLWLVWSK